MRINTYRNGLSITASRASTAFVVFLFYCLFTGTAQAQWEPEVRLTNAPDSSLAYEWYTCLVASGDTLHVVWTDKRGGDWEIYYKRSTDDGVSWGDDVLLSANGPGMRKYKPIPSIAASGSKVHVVWYHDRTGNYELFYRRSMDGGGSWDAEECLYNDNIWSWLASVAVLGNTVHIAWSDARTGSLQAVYHMRSTDDGHTWSEPQRLSVPTTLGHAQGPKMNVSDARVYVSWYYYWGGPEHARYQLSTDGGVSWWGEIDPAVDADYSTNLTVQQSDPYIYYFWEEKQSGLMTLQHRHSTNKGLRWQPEVSIRLQQTDWIYYSYAVSGATVHLTYKDEVNGLGVIRYICSTDAGENWSDPVDISPFSTGANHPSIAISGSALHILLTDYRDGAGEIYYRRNPTGNPVSVEEDHTPLPTDLVLDQNYPNPFSGSSSIRFTVPQQSRAILTLHDLLGRTVATIACGEFAPGTHSARIDAVALSAGCYLCRLTCDGQMCTRMITVMR